MANLPSNDNSVDYFAPRIWIAIAFMLATMGGLTARLWYLQIIRGESYLEMSQSNRVRLFRLPASRGRILDSTGQILAENRPSFTFSILPGELENPREVIQNCSSVLGITEEKMRALIERSHSIPKYMTFPIKKNMSLEELSLIKSHAADSKGVVLEIKPLRLYPFHETLCHEIGSMGEISPGELATASRAGYRTGDLIGKAGIEKEYENYLKGEEGWSKLR